MIEELGNGVEELNDIDENEDKGELETTEVDDALIEEVRIGVEETTVELNDTEVDDT